MPYWWTNAHWRAQYAVDIECRGDISLAAIKAKYTPDKTLCYCPSWTAGKKKGRPKTNVREKSLMDHIAESAKKKRKRKDRMWCKICHQFNHNTDQCKKTTEDDNNNDIDVLMDGLQEVTKPEISGEVGMA